MDETLKRVAVLIDASIYIFQSHFSAYVQSPPKIKDLSALYGLSNSCCSFCVIINAFAAIAHDEVCSAISSRFAVSI